MNVELAITVRNSERSLTERHNLYPQEGVVDIRLSKSDPTLLALAAKAVEHFGEEPEDLVLKFKTIWK